MNKKSIFISVIVPVYKTEKYIENSINSLLSQTFSNYEVILVDDGSPDACPEICDNYAKKYANFRVVHKKNAGLGCARNTGLELATGHYIYYLDSDDTIQEDTFDYFSRVLKKYPDLDMIFSRYQTVTEEDLFKRASIDEGVEIIENNEEIQNAFLQRTHVILAPGTLYKKAFLDDHQLFFKACPYSEDQLFIWETLLHVRKIAYIKKNLYNYLTRKNSIMTSTSLKKILCAYPFFESLNEKFRNSHHASPLAKKFMFSRWCLGIFHSGARLCTYNDFKILISTFNANRHLKTLRSFPSIKIKLLSYIYFISTRLFYTINRHL